MQTRTGGSRTSGWAGFRRRADVLRGVDVEWSVLLADPVARARTREWSAAEEALVECEGVDDVLGRVAGSPDVVLGRLLRWYAAGDALAGRVVLQAMLPKVVLLSARDPAAGVGDYLAALWCEIAAYPLERRPTSVAANLALDTLKAVHRERRPVTDLTTAPELVVDVADRHLGHAPGDRGPHPGPTLGSVLDQARRHRLVDPSTSELLRSVYGEGLSGAAAATRHGLSPGAVRTRCSRALKLLARHADLLAEPA